MFRHLTACLLVASPVVADDAIVSDWNKAKAVHAKEVSRLRFVLLTAFDDQIKSAEAAQSPLDSLLAERKAFEEKGVIPASAKMKVAAKAYTTAVQEADSALEAAYIVAIQASVKAVDTDRAAALKKELREFQRAKNSGDTAAAIAKTGPEEKAGDSILVPLYRFYDKKAAEHLYTCGDTEPAAWRLDPDKKEEALIGYATKHSLPGTTKRLWRAARKDGKHLFYLQAPAKELRVEDFVVFVWTTKGEGRVPIHGCALPDGTDVWFDADQRLIKTVIDDTFNGFGTKRNAFPSAFYLYEKPDGLKSSTDAAKKGK